MRAVYVHDKQVKSHILGVGIIRGRRRYYCIPEPEPAYMMRSRAETEKLKPRGLVCGGAQPHHSIFIS